MTELLMVTEEAEAHVNKNLDTINQTMDNYQQILAKANALIPTDWESRSANDFLNELSQLITNYNAKLEEMTKLVNKLENEIDQWYETADTFTFK